MLNYEKGCFSVVGFVIRLVCSFYRTLQRFWRDRVPVSRCFRSPNRLKRLNSSVMNSENNLDSLFANIRRIRHEGSMFTAEVSIYDYHKLPSDLPKWCDGQLFNDCLYYHIQYKDLFRWLMKEFGYTEIEFYEIFSKSLKKGGVLNGIQEKKR